MRNEHTSSSGIFNDGVSYQEDSEAERGTSPNPTTEPILHRRALLTSSKAKFRNRGSKGFSNPECSETEHSNGSHAEQKAAKCLLFQNAKRTCKPFRMLSIMR